MSYPRRGVVWLVLGKAGWLFILPLLVGLALAVPAVRGLEDGWALSFHGAEVMGQVTDKSFSTRSCGKNNRDTCTDYNLVFEFEASGVMTPGTVKVSEGMYRGLTVTGPIRVRYLKTDPHLTEVEMGSTLSGGVGLALITLAFAGLGLWGLGTGARKATRMIWLRETGLPQQVTVLAQVDAKTRINGKAMWRITWADAAGLASKSRLYRQSDLPTEGSQITVYADSAGKLPSVWEGDCGTR